jgi:hypothetical protein
MQLNAFKWKNILFVYLRVQFLIYVHFRLSAVKRVKTTTPYSSSNFYIIIYLLYKLYICFALPVRLLS